ncbi:MAG: undecaprenyl-diphosphate phosphatase [Candidatus Thorarchaeota archaeon]|jgi:undecaprenyl-diphosphatase
MVEDVHMELWQIIVALIQGLVEWLPISSEGQAVLFAYNFSNVPPESLITLVVWLHLGTALAVIVRYPRTILDVIIIRDRVLFRQLLIATLCTAITAVPLYFVVKESIILFNGEIINILVGILLIVTAIILYLPTRTDTAEIEYVDTSDKVAAVTGLVQGFSVFPGLSRSGVTVSALLMQRVDKETALRFSFLMSVPAVLGIFALEMMLGDVVVPSISVLDLVIIEIIVFVVGLASMEFLLRLARRVSFWKLCVVLAVIAILFGIPALL